MSTVKTPSKSTEKPVLGQKAGNLHETDYVQYLARIQARFNANVAADSRLFEVKCKDLYQLYLKLAESAPGGRQYHNCNACNRFLTRYAHLVTINPDGTLKSVMWDPADADSEFYLKVNTALKQAVESGVITGEFYESETVWGNPKTGNWVHYGIRPPKNLLFTNRLLTVGQHSAKRLEVQQMARRAFLEFSPELLKQAEAILTSGQVPNHQQFLPALQWLATVHANLAGKKGSIRDNLLAKEIAKAPEAFAHIRGSSVGTLLQSLAAGEDATAALYKFKAITHTSVYNRAVAPVKTGAIARAETIIEKLGLQASLNRRSAKISEVETVWTPPVQEVTQPQGIFGHLRPVAAPKPLDLSTKTVTAMTWEKFVATVLPKAISIMAWMKQDPMPFGGIVTASDSLAPPIYRWDSEEKRNPFAWYTYDGGAYCSSFGLTELSWVEVKAITTLPCSWGPKADQTPRQGAYLLLEGASDSADSGSMIFPEFLLGDLQEVRKVIEAHSRKSPLLGKGPGDASGLKLSQERPINIHLSVVLQGSVRSQYLIDRWD